jgi:hypothetical protein
MPDHAYHCEEDIRMHRTLRGGLMQAMSRVFGVGALLLTGTGSAHHSLAMHDQTKSVALQGTVKEFQWTNPHCYIQLLVPSAEGLTEWSIEMHSPLASYRQGWRPGTLKGGEHVTIVIHPMKDGTHGGQLVSATDSSGRALNGAEANR